MIIGTGIIIVTIVVGGRIAYGFRETIFFGQEDLEAETLEAMKETLNDAKKNGHDISKVRSVNLDFKGLKKEVELSKAKNKGDA